MVKNILRRNKISRWLRVAEKTKNIKLIDTDNHNWRSHINSVYPYDTIINHFNKNTNIEDMKQVDNYLEIYTTNSYYKFEFVDQDIKTQKPTEQKSIKNGDINSFIGESVQMVDSTNKGILEQAEGVPGVFDFRQNRVEIHYEDNQIFQSSNVTGFDVSDDSIEVYTANSTYKFKITSDESVVYELLDKIKKSVQVSMHSFDRGSKKSMDKDSLSISALLILHMHLKSFSKELAYKLVETAKFDTVKYWSPEQRKVQPFKFCIKLYDMILKKIKDVM